MSKTIVNSPHLIYESLIPLEEANEYFPTNRSRQTYERWMRPPGCHGVILESVTIGFRRFLSKEGIARFLSGQAGGQTIVRTPITNRSHNGGRMSEQEIAEKSREHGLPES